MNVSLPRWGSKKVSRLPHARIRNAVCVRPVVRSTAIDSRMYPSRNFWRLGVLDGLERVRPRRHHLEDNGSGVADRLQRMKTGGHVQVASPQPLPVRVRDMGVEKVRPRLEDGLPDVRLLQVGVEQVQGHATQGESTAATYASASSALVTRYAS